MNDTTEKRGPGRPRNAVDETEAPKRRRREGGAVHGKRLGVSESRLDFTKYKYRWINDENDRMMAMTRHDDWDIVKEGDSVVKTDKADLGDAVSQVVGSNADGSKKLAYLCRKLKSYYEDDQKGKSAELDRQLKDMRAGNDRSGSKQDADYVVSSRIQ